MVYFKPVSCGERRSVEFSYVGTIGLITEENSECRGGKTEAKTGKNRDKSESVIRVVDK